MTWRLPAENSARLRTSIRDWHKENLTSAPGEVYYFMNKQTSDFSSSSPGFAELSRINVVVVYHDFAAGLRAKAFCDYLGKRFSPEFQIGFKLWRFDILELAICRKAALAEAANADIMVIAAESSSPLPASLMGWLEDWAMQHAVEDAALILLLEHAAGADSESLAPLANLRQLAEHAGAPFFCSGPVSPSDSWHAVFDEIQWRAHALTSTLKQILDHPTTWQRWGINE
jgi:hypothetical protein